MATIGRIRYGKVKGKNEAVWIVSDLRPDVAMTFKRLFPQVKKGDIVHAISDTDAMRADLEWFRQRYPLDLGHPSLADKLADGAKKIAHREKVRKIILSDKWRPPELSGFKPGYAPYTYQAQAAAITLDNEGLLLGDDVGLGKTISTFALACGGAPLPMAIVVEPHLMSQWQKKLTEFTHLRSHVVKKTVPYRLPMSDVVIFSYTQLAGWVEVFSRGLFRSVAYDEIQQLRHGTDTAKGRAAQILSGRAEIRLGLSATPIFNYGDEIYTIMEYLKPGILGSREEFYREYCGYKGALKDPDAVGSFLESSGYLLRRKEDDHSVQQSLPPPRAVHQLVDADQLAIEDQDELLRSLANTVLSGTFVQRGQASRELDIKMRHLTGVSKAPAVALYAKMLLRDREKVVIAGWHRDVYDIWNEQMAEFNPVMYTGTESKRQKDKAVDAFVNGDSRAFFISLRSGAGLDGLQHVCRDIIFGELDWSPQIHYQLRGRLRRPGQLYEVTGHFLHTDFGSDPLVMQTLGVKADQSRGVMDPGSAPPKPLNDDQRIKALARQILQR